MTEIDTRAPTEFPFQSGWANAAAIWLLATAVLGWGCFVAAGRQLSQSADLFWAAVEWQLCFALGLSVVYGVAYYFNRKSGRTLMDIGWRRSCSTAAILGGFLLGLLYSAGAYAGMLAEPEMRDVNPFAVHWVRFALAPLGVYMAFCEEAIMRGYFMQQLERARAGSLLQILLSGACSAVYHALHNPSLIGFVPSFMLFSVHAAIFVAAGRSLTPTIIAHSLYHVLGAPYLLMFAMSQIR